MRNSGNGPSAARYRQRKVASRLPDVSPAKQTAERFPAQVIGPDRRSLLMADDVGNVIWRVTGG
ncbi:MAG: hypothetical protein QOE49_3035 [Rhodospirillaceae bacterium]|nr:hypothetical protein [Rhodospirillaceae bacterium]